MLLNALAALGHRGIKTIATFGRAGLMLFNAVVGKPEFRKHAPLLVRQARYVLRERDPAAMPPMLERTVKGALLTNLLFVVGLVLSKVC